MDAGQDGENGGDGKTEVRGTETTWERDKGQVGGQKQGLFIKIEWLRMFVCRISADDKPCVGLSRELHSGDTRPHVHGFGNNGSVSG